jgi:hypothetical protein
MGKFRTRAHVLEGISVNHIERHILFAGYILHRIGSNDYGYDGFIQTCSPNGEIDGFFVYFQLKATDKIRYNAKRCAFAFDLSVRDLELWLQSRYEFRIILYDGQSDMAYFVNLVEYFKENSEALRNVNKFVRVYLPENQVFNVQSVIDLR